MRVTDALYCADIRELPPLLQDLQYRRFPRNLQSLLMPMFGRMPPIARNVFNALFIVDPSTKAGLA